MAETFSDRVSADVAALGDITNAVERLGIRRVLDVLIDYADNQIDAATAAGDKLARFRAAKDHRELVNLRERVSS